MSTKPLIILSFTRFMYTQDEYTDEECQEAIWAVGCSYDHTQNLSGDMVTTRLRDMAKLALDEGRFSRVETWEHFCHLCDRLGITRYIGRANFNRPEAVPYLESHGYRVVG